MKKVTRIMLFAGLATLGAGFFYSFVKAGVPYQDPPPAILEKYNRDSGIGELLLKIGTGILLWTISVMAFAQFPYKRK